jgi:hypothetical protein
MLRLCNGFEYLLYRSWFRRVWVLQEVAKARRAKVMCGNKIVSSRIFAVVPKLLGVKPNGHQQAVLDIMPGSSRKHSWWTEKRDLGTLLSKFSKAEASGARDMIYALLGISSNAHDNDTLCPDYKKSLEEVFKTTVAFLLDLSTQPDLRDQLSSWTWPEFLGDQNSLQEKDFLRGKLSSEAFRDQQQLLLDVLIDRGVFDGDPLSVREDKDFYRLTPLAWAAQRNCVAAINALLPSYNGDVNAQDWLERTPLHLAVINGHESVVKALLRHRKIEPYICDWFGRTPLSWATGQGQVNIVKMLLDTGKCEDSFDTSGWTPSSLAKANGHEKVVSRLETYAI